MLVGGLLATCAYAQPATQPSTRAATRPATTQATKPARKPDPLATPTGAADHLFKLITAQDAPGLRDMSLQQMTVSETQKKYGNLVLAALAGNKYSVIDTQTSGPVALAICKSVDKNDEVKAIFTVLLFQRFDRWKVEIGQPNVRRLTDGEKENLIKLSQWEQKRVADLREKLNLKQPSSPAN